MPLQDYGLMPKGPMGTIRGLLLDEEDDNVVEFAIKMLKQDRLIGNKIIVEAIEERRGWPSSWKLR